MKKIQILICLFLVFVLLDCVKSQNNITPDSNKIEGKWGGKGIEMNASGSKVTFTFDCADGEIAKEVYFNKDNSFEETGTYKQSAGNVPIGNETLLTRQVRYKGKLDGSNINISIVEKDGVTVLGNFVITKDISGNILRCL